MQLAAICGDEAPLIAFEIVFVTVNFSAYLARYQILLRIAGNL